MALGVRQLNDRLLYDDGDPRDQVGGDHVHQREPRSNTRTQVPVDLNL